MSYMVNMDAQALQRFEAALEEFKQSVESRCNTLESGIDGCSKFMKDESSQKALNEGRAICDRVRACISPTEQLLEMVRNAINFIMDNVPEMGV